MQINPNYDTNNHIQTLHISPERKGLDQMYNGALTERYDNARNDGSQISESMLSSRRSQQRNPHNHE